MSNGSDTEPRTPFPPQRVEVRMARAWNPVEPPVVIDSDQPGVIPLTIDMPSNQAVQIVRARRGGAHRFAIDHWGNVFGYIGQLEMSDNQWADIRPRDPNIWIYGLRIFNRYGSYIQLQPSFSSYNSSIRSAQALQLQSSIVVPPAATSPVTLSGGLQMNSGRLRLRDEQHSTAYGEAFVEGGSLMYTNPDGQKQQLVSVTVSDQEPATPRPGDVWVDVS